MILRNEANPVGATHVSPGPIACAAPIHAHAATHMGDHRDEKGEHEHENRLVVGWIVCRGGDGS